MLLPRRCSIALVRLALVDRYPVWLRSTINRGQRIEQHFQRLRSPRHRPAPVGAPHLPAVASPGVATILRLDVPVADSLSTSRIWGVKAITHPTAAIEFAVLELRCPRGLVATCSLETELLGLSVARTAANGKPPKEVNK
jgi:hypothetical protein